MLSFLRSNKGGSEIFLLLVVIVGAFFLVGGSSFFSGLLDSNYSETKPGSASQSAWAIQLIQTVCDETSHISNISIGLHGPSKGYFTITIDSQVVATFEYTPSAQGSEALLIPLPNTLGFNTKPWVIELFEGGTSNAANIWSGGETRATKSMTATGCK